MDRLAIELVRLAICAALNGYADLRPTERCLEEARRMGAANAKIYCAERALEELEKLAER